MADISRIDNAQTVEVTDGTDQTVAVQATETDGTQIGLVTREARSDQQLMEKSIPVVMASDQPPITIGFDEDSGVIKMDTSFNVFHIQQ